ncbi:junctional sarcoplasmic reticulum protein 1 isoform 2-T2 [Callospermophilus lateralis]|uniref:junctional sarcoplasmic reticulum protein 1 isoform X2 n=1 Tax=Callospermophilus lateralis TaxID=76772 RepID=UPI0040547D32
MTTRASEELDRGLGSCLASEDLSALADPCPGRPPGDKPPETPRLGSSSTWPQDSREAVAVGNVATNPKKMEKEPVVRGSPGAGKEKLKSGANAMIGEGPAPTPAPEPWAPRSSPHRELVPSLPEPTVWEPPSRPPAPQAGPPALQGKTEDSPEVPMTNQAAEKAPGETGEATREAAGEDGGPKERPRKERPRKEKIRKEKPRKERPRVAREAQEALPRRWEARERGHRPWAKDPRYPEHRKRQVWVPPRHPDDEEDGHPGRPKLRAGKGRG